MNRTVICAQLGIATRTHPKAVALVLDRIYLMGVRHGAKLAVKEFNKQLKPLASEISELSKAVGLTHSA